MRALVAWIVVVAACRADPEPPDLGPRPAPVQARAKIATPAVTAGAINPRLLRRFKPIEPLPDHPTVLDVARARLGKQLLYDKRMSRNGTTACATCHPLDQGGMDRLATSPGARGTLGTRNTPTVFNATLHVAQFWDGRAHTAEDQPRFTMLDPGEMAMSGPDQVTSALRAIPAYVAEFAAAFPGEPTPTDFEHAITAIVAFERLLITPSRWDRYLRGDPTALSTVELAGLKLFADIGCMTCHSGELVGGSMFQRAGVLHEWPNQADQGRFDVTHDPADHMVFKVPSLRNVAITEPYFHDGRTRSLLDAVRMMASYQLDTTLSDAEAAAIVAWLGALTGAPSPELIKAPELPPG